MSMKHLVSYSGGVCSFLTAKRVVDMHGPDDVVLLFADTLIEDEDLYRFNDDVSAYLGIPITRVCDGRTPWEIFEDKRYLGNYRVDPCSDMLKRKLLNKWREENCDPQNTILYIGLDWTEEHRLVRFRKAIPGWHVEAPMVDPPRWTKPRMLEEVEKCGIAVPRLYRMGYAHNNCGGFCVKSGHAQFALLLRTNRERYLEHEQHEQNLRELLGRDDVAVMKDRRNGETKPMTLRQFRERIEGGEQDFFDAFDWGGCGCALD